MPRFRSGIALRCMFAAERRLRVARPFVRWGSAPASGAANRALALGTVRCPTAIELTHFAKFLIVILLLLLFPKSLGRLRLRLGSRLRESWLALHRGLNSMPV